MAKLFDVLAGKSDDTFKIGGVEFYAAPLTVTEWGQLARLNDSGGDPLFHFMAEKLQARVKEPTKNPPSEVRAQWLKDNLPHVMMGTLQYALMYGKMPEADSGK